MTDEELIEHSAEHLEYELTMLSETARRLQESLDVHARLGAG
jgi:hypothetical protein